MTNSKKISSSIIMMLILTIGVSPVFAEKTITMEMFETEYNTSGTILIIGNVDTKNTSSPVTLTVYDPSEKIVYKPNVSLDENGQFKWLVKPTLPSFEQGMYTIEASHDDITTPTIVTFHIEESGILESVDTQEIPEFGALTMVVLSISIIAIIIASTKTKVLNILGN